MADSSWPVVQWGKLNLGRPALHLGVVFPDLATQLPIQLSVNSAGKAGDDV